MTQRQATKDADYCWFAVLRIINEPTAAAIAHVRQKLERAETCLSSIDLGWHDVSILTIEDGIFVKSNSWSSHLVEKILTTEWSTILLQSQAQA